MDEKERRLLRDGEEVIFRENGRAERLTPKAFDLLLLLVKQSGQMVGREELMERIWPGTFVEDNRLSDNVSTLRKFLSDRTRNPQFIETIPKYGYRFVADVREVRDEAVALVEHTKTQIVIEEEIETLPADAANAIGHRFREKAVAPALAAAGTSRRLNPMALAAGCVLLAALILATYFGLKARTGPPAGKAPLAKSIAILPFKPLVSSTGDPALELGMTDALITKLSNIRQVVVRPTSSVLKYASEGQDLRAAGDELKVDILLDGKVQKVGDRIRLTVQLVRVDDGMPLWADKFDEKFTNIFEVQDRISERVASQLALRLSDDERDRVAKRYTQDAEAYQFYLKGRYALDQTSFLEERQKSVGYFNQAIEKDPRYALAYAWLANAHTILGNTGLPRKEAGAKAKSLALKALEMDGELGDAHMALGAVLLFHERDLPAAGREIKRAVELNPREPQGHNLYSEYLIDVGRVGEAVAEVERALELDPTSLGLNSDMVKSFYYARRYDEALTHSRKAIALQPNNLWVHHFAALAYAQKAMYGEAFGEINKALPLCKCAREEDPTLGYVYALAGRREEARNVLARLRKQTAQGEGDPFSIALVHTGLGDKEQALAWLERARAVRYPWLTELNADPVWDSLRDQPRFARLVAQTNIPR